MVECNIKDIATHNKNPGTGTKSTWLHVITLAEAYSMDGQSETSVQSTCPGKCCCCKSRSHCGKTEHVSLPCTNGLSMLYPIISRFKKKS